MQEKGSKIVLGPGTGLGAAGMVHAAHTWIPVPGEGGHVEIGPLTDDEYALWPHIERRGNRVEAEAVLSGPGLVRLYRAVASLRGQHATLETPAAISEAGLGGSDQVAAETIEHFARLLGRYAGDMALVFLATGGVHLAGGIAPQIAPALKTGTFRKAFEDKAPHAEVLQSIGTAIVTQKRAALAGLAAFARMPSRFGVELSGRRWSVD